MSRVSVYLGGVRINELETESVKQKLTFEFYHELTYITQ